MNTPETTEILRALESLCENAQQISAKTEGRPVPWHVMIASLVFARLTLAGLSILRLTPGSTWCQPINGKLVWDLPSVASLSRDLVEAYLTLRYVLEPMTSGAGASLLEKVWGYHEKLERFKMLRLAVRTSKGIAPLESEIASRRTAIESDPYFLRLPKDLRKRIILGETAKLRSAEDLCTRAGVNLDYYRSMFKYGSNHTHSSPFSLAQMDGFSASDPESCAVFSLPLQTSTGFTALAIRDFVEVFPDQRESLTKQVRDLITQWQGILRWELNLLSR